MVAKALLTIHCIKLIREKEFADTILDKNKKVFIVYAAFFANKSLKMSIYLFWRAQLALFITDKAFITFFYE